ncbi:MAG: preprotein translocase subunit SecY [Candidatus Rokubacteria bacterium 13_1_40CM_4_69_39]|nr:MAG: preprotein translocase subunit SecY [Candidatus Rokubacteria bacterium 13_1_40CM_69_96]OLC53963.1 MAG: preprotein translocase subunit SecY [Candidatus Rokubacteria bacterium 13_1_40CM_4_69_39]OLD27191.1 MAG: preprotein translocase subunit SecY [Candidatus Rokubacteria bacterium 13_1_40CM_2_70_45]
MIEGLQSFQNVFKIPELKRRVLFTAAMLVAYRIGAHVPTPGIDGHALAQFFDQVQGTLLGMVDLFSGGNLRRLSIFALGIMPYISASIILQLLTVVIPALERLAKEGEAGRKKITQYTRYGTIVLSAVQAMGIAYGLESMRSPSGISIVPTPGWAFRLLTVVTLTAGTALIMWMGEQISEKGIGNGISLIILAGIVVRLPSAVMASYTLISTGELRLFVFLVIVLLMVAVTASVVLMQEGQRKIPVQYAKRVVGRRVYGGQSTHIPLRINTAGVIPVIFASSLILFPATLTRFVPHPWMQAIADALSPGRFTYTLLYMGLIVFFAYFYTAIVFNPIDLADNMKKYGGFIPGVRPGKKTAEYIDRTLTRITLPGALFLALISVLPDYLIRWFNVPFYFGGTSLLIVVGVALDTVRQMESHLLMRNYEGFLKRSKSRSSGAFARG